MNGSDWNEVSIVDILFSNEAASIIMKSNADDGNFLIHVSIETGSILLDLFQKQRFRRPDTFTLLSNCITSLGATIHSIAIDDACEGIFFAKVTLKQHGNLFSLDARPSDAIALAIVNSKPIFASRDLLQRLPKFDAYQMQAHRARVFSTNNHL